MTDADPDPRDPAPADATAECAADAADAGAFACAHPGGWTWRHLRAADAEAFEGDFIAGGAGPNIAALLSEAEPRSFCGADHDGDGLVLILRGVNFNVGAEPEDAVAFRVYADARGLVTASVADLRAVDRAGRAGVEAFATPYDAMLDLVEEINDGWREAAHEAEMTVDDLEEEALEKGVVSLHALQRIRGRVIWLARHAGPNAEALMRLADRERKLLPTDRFGLARSCAQSAQRVVEALNAVRDHAAAIQAHIDSVAADRARRSAHRLALVATIFLPLNFLGALMGANVSGIPGGDSPWGFAALAAVMVALGLAAWAFLRRLD